MLQTTCTKLYIYHYCILRGRIKGTARLNIQNIVFEWYRAELYPRTRIRFAGMTPFGGLFVDGVRLRSEQAKNRFSWSPPFESPTHTINNLVHGSTCCARDNGTRNVVSIRDYLDHAPRAIITRTALLPYTNYLLASGRPNLGFARDVRAAGIRAA